MNKILKGYQVCLRSVTKADLEQLRQWRNDPWVKQFMLTQQNISDEQQLAWFHKIKADMTILCGRLIGRKPSSDHRSGL